jgi:peptide-methionine (R)-S-oxide reductase
MTTSSNKDWKKELPPDVYHVTREKGTEAPFTGKYWNDKRSGMYRCSNCGMELFSSETKFDSGTGWPSFTCPVEDEKIKLVPDTSHGMERTEAVCANCGAHLGHVFNDGPGATGERYCINSLSLDLEEDGNAAKRAV